MVMVVATGRFRRSLLRLRLLDGGGSRAADGGDAHDGCPLDREKPTVLAVAHDPTTQSLPSR
jgi:hypothetical protein